MPDYLGLAAFNRLDTILHTIVAVTGLLSALLTKEPLRGLRPCPEAPRADARPGRRRGEANDG